MFIKIVKSNIFFNVKDSFSHEFFIVAIIFLKISVVKQSNNKYNFQNVVN